MTVFGSASAVHPFPQDELRGGQRADLGGDVEPNTVSPGPYTRTEVADMVLARLSASRHPQSVTRLADDLDLTWHTVKDAVDYLERGGQVEKLWRLSGVYGFVYEAKAAA